MDGSSYTNHSVWNQNSARSPMTPSTPSSSATAYRTNINRQKTKKWVEAKSQNYDGDDWGDDYDQPDEPLPPPPKPTGSRQPGQGTQPPVPPLPSGPAAAASKSIVDVNPSENSEADPISAVPPNSSMSATTKPPGGPPALHIHTQQPFGAVSPSEPAHCPVPQSQPPLGRGDQPMSPQSPGTVAPSGPSSVYSHSEAGYTPASLTHPSPVIAQLGPVPNRYPPHQASTGRVDKPADVYRRIGEEFERERLAESPKPTNDIPATSSGQAGRATHLKAHGPPQSSAVKPQVTEATSPIAVSRDRALESNISPGAQTPPAPAPAPQSVHQGQEQGDEARRYSTSPQLPNLGRMSVFAVDDIFSGYNQTPAKAPEVPPIPENIVFPISPHNSEKLGASPHESGPVPSQSPAPAQLGSGESGMPVDSKMPMEKAMSEHLGSRATTPANNSSHSTGTSGGEHENSNSDTDAPLNSRLTIVEAPRDASPEIPKSPQALELLAIRTLPATGSSAASSKKLLDIDPGEVSPVSDTESENEYDVLSGGGAPTVPPGEHATPHALPPLHTASSSAPLQGENPSNMVTSPQASAGVADMTPIAPLNPHRSDNSPDEFVPPAITRDGGTMSTIASPSPVKESDRLREEIINSLSPVGPGPDSFKIPEQPTEHRQSGFDTAQQSDGSGRVSPQKLSAPETLKASKIERAQSSSPIPQAIPREPRPGTADSPHRRFSWEDGPEQVTISHEEEVSDEESVAAPPPKQKSAVQPMPVIEEPAVSSPAQPEVIQMTIPPPNAGTMSHQVSQVSNVPRQGLGALPLDPPSPISVVTEKGGEEPSHLSLSSGESASATPPPQQAKALAADNAEPSQTAPEEEMVLPPQSTVKLMTFREILSIPSPEERTKKYDETRAQFMAMETGLSHFLSAFKASNSELVNTTSIFPTPQPKVVPGGVQQMALGHADGAHGHSHLHSQPSAQQPYYQQYLQASSPTVQAAGAAGQAAPGQGGTQPQMMHAYSDFKHPGNQIGHKGKEFLSTAGKVGKGLLHKGRNKLRGTGDKAEEQSTSSYGPPPPSHLNKKTDRRTSWGLSLGGRVPRGDGPTPHNMNGPPHSFQQQQQPAPSVPSAPSPAPQLPEPSRISPFSSISQGGHSPGSQAPSGGTGGAPIGVVGQGQGQGPNAPPGQRKQFPPTQSGAIQPNSVQQRFAGPASATSQTDLVSPVSDTHSTPRPGDVAHVPPQTSQTNRQQATWNSPQGHPGTAGASGANPRSAPHSRGPSAGNVIADDKSDDWVVVSAEPDSGRSHTAPQDPTPTDLSSEPADGLQQDSQLPARHSSFVGLPPIRRSSTFGLSIGKKGRGTEESTSPTIPEVPPLPLQSGEEPAPQATAAQPEQPQDPTQANTNRLEFFPSTVPKHGSMDPNTLPHPSESTMPPLPTITQQGPSVITPQLGPAQDGIPRGGAPSIPNQPGSMQGQQQHPLPQGQFIPPVARLQPGMVAPQVENNPKQQIPRPPPGWRVEESHLSEPLLPTSRQRAASNAASVAPSNATDRDEPEDYSFDKETEAGLSQPRPRESKPSPGQQQRQGSSSQAPPSPRPQASNSPTIRHHQRGASISGEPSVHPHWHQTDDSSNPASKEGPQRRHSGFPSFGRGGLSNLAASSSDGMAQGREGTIATSLNQVDQRTQDIPSPQFPPLEKKRTFFGKNAFAPGMQQKSPKPGISRSSTSNSMSMEGPGPKKRFSGLTTMFQKTGGNQEHHTQKPPGIAHAGPTSLQNQASPYVSPQPNPVPNGQFGRDWSNTTGSGPSMAIEGSRPQSHDLRHASPAEDGRGRRAISSGGGFLSGLFGRPPSRPREPKSQHGHPPGQVYAPSGPPGSHPQGPRIMLPPVQGGQGPAVLPQSVGSMYPGPQGPQGPVGHTGQPVMGQGGPQTSGQMYMTGQYMQLLPGQRVPGQPGPLPLQPGPPGTMVQRPVLSPPPGANRSPPGQADPRFPQPVPAAETRPVPSATSPSPLSQRSQALTQPPPTEGLNTQRSSQHVPASVSVTTPSSPRPDDGIGALDGRTSSPASRRSVEPPVGRNAPVGSAHGRLSQQSSRGSPAAQVFRPVNHQSPQPKATTRFSDQTDAASHRPSIQTNDMRRASTPSLAQSSPMMSEHAQPAPGVQQQRLPGQGNAAFMNPSAPGVGERRMSDAITPVQQGMMPPPTRSQTPIGPSRANTQTTQMPGSPALAGMPRPAFLPQQQSFASGQSTTSSHESHGIPKLLGLKSKLPGGSSNSVEKHEKKASFLSAFKKSYRQAETGPQQPVAINQHPQPQHPQPPQGQPLPARPMPGPHQQYQDQRPNAMPPAPAQINVPPGPTGSAQPPMGNLPSGRNSLQHMPPAQAGQHGQQPLIHPSQQPTPAMAQDLQRRPSAQQQAQEPQYESVPIPQAYRPVHGDGTPVASPYAMMPSYFIQPQGWAPRMAPSQGQRNGAVGSEQMIPPHIMQGRAPIPPPSVAQSEASPSQEHPPPSGLSHETAQNHASNGSHPSTNLLHAGPNAPGQRHLSDVGQLSSVAPLPGHQASRRQPSDVSQMSLPVAQDKGGAPIQHSHNLSATSASSQPHGFTPVQDQPRDNNCTVDAGAANASSRDDAEEPTPKPSDPKSPTTASSVGNNPVAPSPDQPSSQPAEVVIVSDPVAQKPHDPKPEPNNTPEPEQQQPRAKDPPKQEDSGAKTASKPTSTTPTAGPSNSASTTPPSEVPRVHAPFSEEKQVTVNLKDQEEKILVETDQNDRPRHGDEEMPMMSATSYPGQEWNPYGGFEDWD
ncbi:uncharacterized protein MKZ38_003501 [Zalerion maritima]|uniref:Uncharacterized protein n=1 Tax=Zalerion maritima TaxID=339359 RepID=A0AAD5WUL8_9PEZI|nr:uncharacterized protein MKZ38_003501 [Zalerion maritima]